jgi:O-methyltransferase
MLDWSRPDAMQQASQNSTCLASSEDLYERYLDLIATCLTGAVYPDEYTLLRFRVDSWQARVFEPLKRLLSKKDYHVFKHLHPTAQDRELGLYWPAQGQTMIGRRRLGNIRECLETVLQEAVPGDVMETGVWRGGACIFAKAILAAHGSDRVLWVADSFEGVPKPKPDRYPADAAEERKTAFYKFPQLAVTLEEVRENFRRYGLLDDRVRFLKGWFCDTLPNAPIERLALLRLDGDLYESTWDALSNLYPKLSPGGYCLIDDYGGIPACAQAVHDYRNREGITEEIVPVDTSGIYWRRKG